MGEKNAILKVNIYKDCDCHGLFNHKNMNQACVHPTLQVSSITSGVRTLMSRLTSRRPMNVILMFDSGKTSVQRPFYVRDKKKDVRKSS